MITIEYDLIIGGISIISLVAGIIGLVAVIVYLIIRYMSPEDKPKDKPVVKESELKEGDQAEEEAKEEKPKEEKPKEEKPKEEKPKEEAKDEKAGDKPDEDPRKDSSYNIIRDPDPDLVDNNLYNVYVEPGPAPTVSGNEGETGLDSTLISPNDDESGGRLRVSDIEGLFSSAITLTAQSAQD
jgi:FtsZ-interacting cell division protein ZipA